MSDHLDSESLSALIDGRAEPGARPALEAHLASCASCAGRKAALETAVRAVRGLGPAAPTAAEARELRRAVLEHAAPAARRDGAAGLGAWRRGLAWRFYAAAGVVALVIAGVAGYAVLGTGLSSGTRSSSGPATVAGPHAQAGATPTVRQGGEPGSAASLDFSSDADVRAYVASQPSLTQQARTLQAGTAATATNGFFQTLLPGIPTAAEAAPALPAPTGASGAPGSDKAAGGTGPPASSALAACLQKVLAVVPPPAAPLAATAVTYRGAPAWLLVYASALPATPAASSPPGVPGGQEQIWVESQASCDTLDHAVLTP